MTKEERAYNYASTRKATKFQVGEIAKFYNDGYEQAEKDIISIVKDYLDKGLRCMESDESQIHAFWDGFQNCAESILRELEEKKSK